MTQSKDLQPGKLSLEELKLIEQGWYQEALKAGYPDICWTILDQLGHVIKLGSRETAVWQVGNIVLFGLEDTDRFDTATKSWKMNRNVTAIFADPKMKDAPLTNKADFDKFILSSEMVMHWSWYFFESEPDKVFEETKSCLFINGDWILSVRDHLGEAQAKQAKVVTDTTEQERVRLENKLLIGKKL